jgi:pilus assembly protein TadC
MFDRYKKITYTFLFLLYIITPLYIIIYSNSLVDYAIAAFILTLGFILQFIIENGHKKRVREFLLKWF